MCDISLAGTCICTQYIYAKCVLCILDLFLIIFFLKRTHARTHAHKAHTQSTPMHGLPACRKKIFSPVGQIIQESRLRSLSYSYSRRPNSVTHLNQTQAKQQNKQNPKTTTKRLNSGAMAVGADGETASVTTTTSEVKTLKRYVHVCVCRFTVRYRFSSFISNV